MIDATLKRFKTYPRRWSVDEPAGRLEDLTEDHVRQVMTSEFDNQRTQTKKKLFRLGFQ